MPMSRLCGASRITSRVAELQAAVVRPDEAGEHHQQRGLAGARRAEQRQEFAAADVEVDVVERGDRAVASW